MIYFYWAIFKCRLWKIPPLNVKTYIKLPSFSSLVVFWMSWTKQGKLFLKCCIMSFKTFIFTFKDKNKRPYRFYSFSLRYTTVSAVRVYSGRFKWNLKDISTVHKLYLNLYIKFIYTALINQSINKNIILLYRMTRLQNKTIFTVDPCFHLQS